jgi:uncharacterized protein (TIGR03546 family)
MITIFKLIKNMLKYLNSNERVEFIAQAITLAMIFGWAPFNLIIHSAMVIAMIVLKGNALFFIVLVPIFLTVSPAIYGVNHMIGDFILTTAPLRPLFVWLADIPLMAFLNWNNTVSLGGYLLMMIGFYPLYRLNGWLVTRYRLMLLPKLKASKLAKVFKLPSWLGRFLP